MPDSAHPRGVQLYPNLTCNYSCDFCFNRGLSESGMISPSDFSSLISVLRQIGVESIDILGGEPTLHPNIAEFAAIINDNNLSATISTNGSNINMLRCISSSASGSNVKIGVSVNDKIPEALDDFIMEHKPYVKSVASNKASPVPEAAAKYIGQPGINYYLIFRDAMSQADLRETLPFYEYYEKLNTLKQSNNGVDGVYCGGFLPDTEVYPELEGVRCPAGTTKAAVLPNGDVYPCNLFFRSRKFRLGNIFTDDFQLIWESPVLDFFRSFTGSACLHCALNNQCRGGCPAVSYAITGRLDAPDPRCL
ncbi:radical SAM/SPASM domain-containing protein [Candidatus Magnetominusculus xianensis]|nr:radical SAM protein [Candidatus Magnetominusculus xianensis]MBF0403847.1 radical SAM protein [Nitrospirota bacterium]